MLQVQGRSDLFLGLEIIKKIIGITPLAVCYFYGVMPMLFVNLFIGIICYLLNSYFPGKLLGYTSWMQLKDIAPSYGLATLIALLVYFLKYLPISYWSILPIQIVLGFVVFFFFCEKIKLDEYQESKAMVMPFIAKFKKH